MATLELENLNKTYTAKVVPVKDVSLSVEEGEFLTLWQVYNSAVDCGARSTNTRLHQNWGARCQSGESGRSQYCDGVSELRPLPTPERL
jgi:hypothetical protein